MATPRQRFYRQFLAGMALLGLAGSATMWWAFGFWLALAYLVGFITPLVYAFTAPTYTQPDLDHQDGQDADAEDRGYQ